MKATRIVSKKNAVTGDKQTAAEVGFPTRKACLAAYFRIHELNTRFENPRFRVHFPVQSRQVETQAVVMLVNNVTGDKETGLLQKMISDEAVNLVPGNGSVDPIYLSIWMDGMGAHAFAFATLHSNELFHQGKTTSQFVAGYLGGEKVLKVTAGSLWNQMFHVHNTAFSSRLGK